MKSKEFFDLAVKMRYVQKHYYLSTDKETRKAWRRACKAYEKKMDDEIDRVTAIIREKSYSVLCSRRCGRNYQKSRRRMVLRAYYRVFDQLLPGSARQRYRG